MGVEQNPHRLAIANGIGAIDLSIKPIALPQIKTKSPTGLVWGNRLLTSIRGEYQVAKNEEEYQRCIADASHIFGVLSAIDRFQGLQEAKPSLITMSDELIKSPLTDQLRDRFGNSSKMYAALFLHLYRFL